MLGKTIVITRRWGEHPYLRGEVRGPSLREKSGPRNRTHQAVIAPSVVLTAYLSRIRAWCLHPWYHR